MFDGPDADAGGREQGLTDANIECMAILRWRDMTDAGGREHGNIGKQGRGK